MKTITNNTYSLRILVLLKYEKNYVRIKWISSLIKIKYIIDEI